MKKAVIFLHKWLGAGFALLFLMWFASGIVMYYLPFPTLGAGGPADQVLISASRADDAVLPALPGDTVAAALLALRAGEADPPVVDRLTASPPARP